MTGLEFDAALRKLGWSGKRASERLDVHKNSVSMWRRGKVSVPGPVAAYVRLKLELLEKWSDLEAL